MDVSSSLGTPSRTAHPILDPPPPLDTDLISCNPPPRDMTRSCDAMEHARPLRGVRILVNFVFLNPTACCFTNEFSFFHSRFWCAILWTTGWLSTTCTRLTWPTPTTAPQTGFHSPSTYRITLQLAASCNSASCILPVEKHFGTAIMEIIILSSAMTKWSHFKSIMIRLGYISFDTRTVFEQLCRCHLHANGNTLPRGRVYVPVEFGRTTTRAISSSIWIPWTSDDSQEVRTELWSMQYFTALSSMSSEIDNKSFWRNGSSKKPPVTIDMLAKAFRDR